MSETRDKVMLVALNMSYWTARKYDKKVSDKVDRDYASHDAGRYNKMLIAQDAVKKYVSAISELRTKHYELTIPYGDNGQRLLPVALKSKYDEVIRAGFDKINGLVSEFVENYPALIDEARYRLNGMFQAADYPGADTIRSKFAFSVSFYPVPSGDHFLVDLADTEIESIRAAINQERDDLESIAMADLWRRMFEPVAHMVERLSKENGKFKDSLIGNIQTVVDIMGGLNFKGDEGIEAMRIRLFQRLAGLNPEELRNERVVRVQAVNDAQIILNDVARVLGVNAGDYVRKLRLSYDEGQESRPVRRVSSSSRRVVHIEGQSNLEL